MSLRMALFVWAPIWVGLIIFGLVWLSAATEGDE